MTVTIFLIRFRAADYVIAKNSAGEYKEFNHPIFQVCQSLIIYDARLPLLPNQILGQCFLEPAKYFGQIYALVRPLEVKGASADGILSF